MRSPDSDENALGRVVTPSAIAHLRRWHRRADGVAAAGRRAGGRLEGSLPGPVRAFERWLRGPEFVVTSSSLAFYALVSIPPMVLIAVWVAGAVLSDGQLDAVVDAIGQRPRTTSRPTGSSGACSSSAREPAPSPSSRRPGRPRPTAGPWAAPSRPWRRAGGGSPAGRDACSRWGSSRCCRWSS